MTHSDWLEKLSDSIRRTPDGLRVDVRLYIHPDGHGDIRLVTETGGGGQSQPVSDPKDAATAIRDLWERAVEYPTDEAPEAKAIRGSRMELQLNRLAELGAFRGIEDPVAWQREQREDRDLDGSTSCG